MAAITVADLTTGDVTGTGVFDQLMRATKAHLAEEYSKSRIKGSEYATVYLGAMQSVMSQSLQYLLQEQRTDLEAQLLQEQIETEGLNQLQVTEQTQNIVKQRLQTEAQTGLIEQQTQNAVTENTVLVAQECKIRAEFDLLMEQKLKTISETALLNQKKVTEAAQVSSVGVDTDSLIGQQTMLHKNQALGYIRDAEQKAAKLFADNYNVRQTTAGGVDPAPVGFTNENIAETLYTLMKGVNATVTPYVPPA